jgi:flagellar biogenesis protein FliO
MQPQRPVPRKATARAAEPRAKGSVPQDPSDRPVSSRLLPEQGGSAGLPLVILGVLGFIAGAIFEQATSAPSPARAEDPPQPTIPGMPVIAPPPLAQPAVAPPGGPISPPKPPVHPVAPTGTAATPAPPAAVAPPASGVPAPAPAPAAAEVAPAVVPADAAPAPAASPPPEVVSEPIRFKDSPTPPVEQPMAPSSEKGPTAPPRTDTDAGASQPYTRLLLVIVLLGAALVGWYVIRRRAGGLNGLARDQLQVLGSVNVGGRYLVAMVRVPGRTLVVGATDKGLSLLSEIRDEGDDRLPALPEGLSRDPSGLFGGSPESSRGPIEGAGRGRNAGGPFDSVLFDMLRNGQLAGSPGPGEPPPRGGGSPVESPEARALRARLQRQQPLP